MVELKFAGEIGEKIPGRPKFRANILRPGHLVKGYLPDCLRGPCSSAAVYTGIRQAFRATEMQRQRLPSRKGRIGQHSALRKPQPKPLPQSPQSKREGTLQAVQYVSPIGALPARQTRRLPPHH